MIFTLVALSMDTTSYSYRGYDVYTGTMVTEGCKVVELVASTNCHAAYVYACVCTITVLYIIEGHLYTCICSEFINIIHSCFGVNKFSLFNDSNHSEALAGDILQASPLLFPAATAKLMPCIVGSNDSENDLLYQRVGRLSM